MVESVAERSEALQFARDAGGVDWLSVRGEGRLRAVGRYAVLPGSAGLLDEFQIVQIIFVF